MNGTVKRVIAREGLIIISLILIGLVTIFTFEMLGKRASNELNALKKKYDIEIQYSTETWDWVGSVKGKTNLTEYTDEELLVLNKAFRLRENADNLNSNGFLYGISLPILGYPFYLLFRFIFWAIKTLRVKET